MNDVIVIPARLASSRFPNKILLNIHGLPMVEHVRRRALMCKNIDEVYVATCDYKIKEILESFGAKVIMTSKLHENGTSRVAEAIKLIECSNVILLQGDEPLILPRHIDLMVEEMKKDKNCLAWNATGPIFNIDELSNPSFVKCSVSNNRILYCYRNNPSFISNPLQLSYIRKMLGLIAFNKEFLINLSKIKQSQIEKTESIEQMKIIENGFNINSIEFELSQPSINEPSDEIEVLRYIEGDLEQKVLMDQVLNYKSI